MLRLSASFRSHWAEIRNCMVWSRRPVYSCWHCALRSLAWGLGVPFGTGWLLLPATHLVKLGGSGTTRVEPGAPACWWAAAESQWLNSVLVMTVSPTFATPLAGT